MHKEIFIIYDKNLFPESINKITDKLFLMEEGVNPPNLFYSNYDTICTSDESFPPPDEPPL